MSCWGVQPNPVVSMVRRGIELCRAEKVDFLLTVGGGSVIDSMKAIGVGLTYKGDVWDFFDGKCEEPRNVLPNGVILTIPAAGSEGSPSMVITNEDGLFKRGYDCQASRPVFSILNPELTMTLPPFQTACGISDMMAHIMERYFTNTTQVDMGDRMCEAILRTIIKAASVVMSNPNMMRVQISCGLQLSHTTTCYPVDVWVIGHRIIWNMSFPHCMALPRWSLAVVFPA